MVETIRYVLIVDDSEDHSDILAITLSRAEYVVRTASDRSAALDILKFGEPDVVLMDWFMPGVTLDDFVVKARELYPLIQIILVSAGLTAESKAQKLGIGFLKKPYDPDELLAQVAIAKNKRRERE